MEKLTFKKVQQDSEKRGVPSSTVRSWKRRGIPPEVMIDMAIYQYGLLIQDIVAMNDARND